MKQEFVLTPKDARVLYGTNHSLDCLAVGIPEPTISWTIKNKFETFYPISVSSDKFRLLKDGKTLQIINSSIYETGKYFCISHSPGLIRNKSAIVEVYGMYYIHKNL